MKKKKSLHQAIVFDQWDNFVIKTLKISKWPNHLSIRGRRLLCRKIVSERLDLQQLQQLERLERLERLELTSLSYDEVQIKPNSIVYCDPPYKGTAGYLHEFDHDKFWEWVRASPYPIFISEYNAPSDIKTIMAIRHKKTNSQTTTDSVEKLFCNEIAWKMTHNSDKTTVINAKG